jgi:hypothetical protein
MNLEVVKEYYGLKSSQPKALHTGRGFDSESTAT